MLGARKEDTVVVRVVIGTKDGVYNGEDKRTRRGRGSDYFQSARLFFLPQSSRRLVAQVVVIDYLRVVSGRGLWPLKEQACWSHANGRRLQVPLLRTMPLYDAAKLIATWMEALIGCS